MPNIFTEVVEELPIVVVFEPLPTALYPITISFVPLFTNGNVLFPIKIELLELFSTCLILFKSI